MATTKYSHAFLVGCFNGKVIPQDLIKEGWLRKKLSKEEYNYRLSMYYKSHVDAMLEADGQNRPIFLEDVHHYQYSYQIITTDENGYDKFEKIGEPVSLNIKKDGKMINYPLFLCNLDLYIFPFDIALVSIEIDDTGTDLNFLTLAHGNLVNWESNINKIADEKLKKNLAPLSKYLPNEDLATLVLDGNNLKIFQIVQGEDEAPNDERLFEIATFSPIQSVKGNSESSHSEAYFKKIMTENSVSTYFNWKGLALVDSYTVLGGKDFEKKIWQWINLYYPLVYLRCIFEKTFCFSHNNAYRLDDKQKTVKDLSDDIVKMEKYYFYGNFSYNFQPNLVYEAMSKGLDIITEREELSKQVKERALEERKVQKENEEKLAQEAKLKEEMKKEKEERKRNLILAFVSVFAVFSIIWDLCQIVKDAFSINTPMPARGFILFALFLIVLLLILIYWKRDEEF